MLKFIQINLQRSIVLQTTCVFLSIKKTLTSNYPLSRDNGLRSKTINIKSSTTIHSSVCSSHPFSWNVNSKERQMKSNNKELHSLSRLLSSSKRASKMPIKAALIDLSGTLHVEDDPTPDAIAALKRLRQTGIHIKFVTNTTKESGETLYNRLAKMGFELEKQEIYSSLSATANYVKSKKLNPFYLVSADARKDFPPEVNNNYDAVVVGLAPNEFHYENMNKAFRILLENKNSQLIAVHQGKYYKRGDGLALGPGCFVKGLEYAASVSAVLIGKPNQYFFESAIPEGITPEECVMIGDDTNDDCMGSMAVGMKSILVKTGKYLPHVVADPPPTLLAENFAEGVKWLVENKDKAFSDSSL